MNRAELLFGESDLAGALGAAREAESIIRERGEEGGLHGVLLNIAAYLLALSRFEEASTAAREGLELALRADVALRVAMAIGHLGHVAAETGHTETAARLLGYADTVYRTTGNAREPTEQRGYDRALDLIRRALAEDRISTLMMQGAEMEQDAAVGEALAVPLPPASHAPRFA